MCEDCSVCCTKEHLAAPIKWLAASTKNRCPLHPPNSQWVFFKYILAHSIPCCRPSIFHHCSYTVGVVGYQTLSCPGVKAAKFTSTDNYSFGQDSHQQTRVHVTYLCVATRLDLSSSMLPRRLLVANFNTAHVLSVIVCHFGV